MEDKGLGVEVSEALLEETTRSAAEVVQRNQQSQTPRARPLIVNDNRLWCHGRDIQKPGW